MNISQYHKMIGLVLGLAPGVSFAGDPALPVAPAGGASIPAIESAIEHQMLIANPSGNNSAAIVAEIDTQEESINRLLSKEPNSDALLYERAFAEFASAVPLKFAKDRKGVTARYKKADADLQSIKGEPWAIEALGFRGYVLTQRIAVEGGLAAMQYGPESEQLLDEAARKLPHNPRILLFRGLFLWSTPESYGGNPEEGLKLLEESRTEFSNENPAADGPHWGKEYALGWLGSARLKNKDALGAWRAWREATALAPDYALLQMRLLPSLAKRGFVPPKS